MGELFPDGGSDDVMAGGAESGEGGPNAGKQGENVEGSRGGAGGLAAIRE